MYECSCPKLYPCLKKASIKGEFKNCLGFKVYIVTYTIYVIWIEKTENGEK